MNTPPDHTNPNDPSTSSPDEQERIEQQTRTLWESFRPSFNEWSRESGEAQSEYDENVEGHVTHARVRYQKERIEGEMQEFAISPSRITQSDLTSIVSLLSTNPHESEMHEFLAANPQFLNQALRAGHGRYQISKQRLGSQLITDFLLADVSSIGIEWYAVELESPRGTVHRKDGRPTADVHHAIDQILDWRNWLMSNFDYARRSVGQDGLGLIGIDHRIHGLVIMGRRSDFPERYNQFRRNMIDRERIEIHSYDWLVELAERSLNR